MSKKGFILEDCLLAMIVVSIVSLLVTSQYQSHQNAHRVIDKYMNEEEMFYVDCFRGMTFE